MRFFHPHEGPANQHPAHKPSDGAVSLIEAWRSENIYPYEGEPAPGVEESERRLFNAVALTVHSFLPGFPGPDPQTARFQLQLLRHALGHAPGGLARTLSDVLNLPPDRRQELAELLDRTSLSHLVSTSHCVSGRLELLRRLETVVGGTPTMIHGHGHGNGHEHERSRLHRLLGENAWIFNEQHHLSMHDHALEEVLRHHFKDAEQEGDEAAGHIHTGHAPRDLLFGRTIPSAGAQPEHLAVLLKSPGTAIDATMTAELKRRALAAAADERLQQPAQWVFWMIGDALDPFTTGDVSREKRPPGLFFESGSQGGSPVTIWVKTWSQLIGECHARMRFCAEKLNHPDRHASLNHP